MAGRDRTNHAREEYRGDPAPRPEDERSAARDLEVPARVEVGGQGENGHAEQPPQHVVSENIACVNIALGDPSRWVQRSRDDLSRKVARAYAPRKKVIRIDTAHPVEHQCGNLRERRALRA